MGRVKGRWSSCSSEWVRICVVYTGVWLSRTARTLPRRTDGSADEDRGKVCLTRLSESAVR